MCISRIEYPVPNEDMKKCVRFKIRASLFYFFLILVLPWVLKLLKADFIPCWKFIFAVILGFFFANVRAILKGVKVKPIKEMRPTYLLNYPITVIAICVIGSYFLDEVWQLKQTVSLVILFCLGFAVDSIFYVLTHLGDLLHK